jgi:hypothetical protein
MEKEVEVKLNKIYVLKFDTPTRKKGEMFIHRIGRETKKAVCLERWYLSTKGEWDHATLWLPKSQIKHDNHKIVLPRWLHDRYSFDLLELAD